MVSRIVGFTLVGLASATTLPAQDPALSTVTGVAVGQSAAPVDGAVVTLISLRRSVTTDAQGRFRFDAVPAGSYVLEVRRIGFIPLQHHFTLEPGRTVHLELQLVGREILLDPITVEIADAGLRGVVHDRDYDPIVRAEISPQQILRRYRTRGDGWFFAPDLPAGKHLIRVTADGFEPRLFSVEVPAGEGRVVSIQLRPTTQARSNLAEQDWANAQFRRRWAQRARATMLTQAELGRGWQRVADIPQIRNEAGPNPCVHVDGRPTVLSLEHFHVDDVEAVEVYPPGSQWNPGVPRRTTPTLGRALGGAGGGVGTRDACSSQVVIWLKAI
jgi:hypothetical protein